MLRERLRVVGQLQRFRSRGGAKERRGCLNGWTGRWSRRRGIGTLAYHARYVGIGYTLPPQKSLYLHNCIVGRAVWT